MQDLRVKEYDIEKELALYKLRKVEVEDMKLKIEQIKLGDNLNSISYSEKVASSPKGCVNNDKDMELIDRLTQDIKRKELANKRVDNILSVLEEDEYEVIESLKIDKLSRSRTLLKLNISNSTMQRRLKSALSKINQYIKWFDG